MSFGSFGLVTRLFCNAQPLASVLPVSCAINNQQLWVVLACCLQNHRRPLGRTDPPGLNGAGSSMTLLVLRRACIINQDSHTADWQLSPGPGITGFSRWSFASLQPFALTGLGFFDQLLWGQNTQQVLPQVGQALETSLGTLSWAVIYSRNISW